VYKRQGVRGAGQSIRYGWVTEANQ